MKQSVVLFSGGIDSTTALYWALSRSGRSGVVVPLTFDYGQRHRIEVGLAKRLTRKLGLPHVVLRIDLRQIGGSALTDAGIALPSIPRVLRDRKRIPATYVPFRNGVFFSLAAAWAEAHDARELICGFNIIDSPNYPDTRPPFVRAMELAIKEGTAAAFGAERIRIRAPFIKLRKSKIIELGLSLGADYSYCVSCYSGREIPCRRCSACLLRERAWAEVGLLDPLLLRLKKEGRQ